MSDWDSEDFVLPAVEEPIVNDKWAGEDEEVSLKDSWDDETEDKGTDEQQVVATKKKKKKLADILAEKEREKERKRNEREEALRALSPEEKTAEKMRIQASQEESDLALVTEIMGLKTEDTKEEEPSSLDSFDLSSEDGLTKFMESLLCKIRNTEKLEKKIYYVSFVEDLCRSLCDKMESDDVKRVTTVLNTLYNEKVKATKSSKGKKKGAAKAKLNSGQGAIADSVANDFGFDEYDDFI